MTTKRIPFLSRKVLLSVGLILPMLVLLVTLRFYPIVSAFFHSFFRWDGFQTGRFLGLANYERLVQDANMVRAAGNIGKFVVSRLFLNLTFAMLGALLIYHPYDGVLNRVLGAIGLEQLQRIWLGDFDTAL